MPEAQQKYHPLIERFSCAGSVTERMQAVADALWDAFSTQGYSWVGFYLEDPDAPEDSRLLLGPRRDKPACSPIGLNGACGKALLTRETLIVRDVKDLGAHYIACDPRDQSEIVIPLLSDEGKCWAVLDIDSYEIGAFDESDEKGLCALLKVAGLLPG